MTKPGKTIGESAVLKQRQTHRSYEILHKLASLLPSHKTIFGDKYENAEGTFCIEAHEGLLSSFQITTTDQVSGKVTEYMVADGTISELLPSKLIPSPRGNGYVFDKNSHRELSEAELEDLIVMMQAVIDNNEERIIKEAAARLQSLIKATRRRAAELSGEKIEA